MPHIALIGCTSGSGPRLLAAARRLGYRVTAVLPSGSPRPVTEHVLVGEPGELLAALRRHNARHPLDGITGNGAGVSEELAALSALALDLPGADPAAVGRAAALTRDSAGGAGPSTARSDAWAGRPQVGPRYVLPVLVGGGVVDVVALGALPGPPGSAPEFPASGLLPWQRRRLTGAAAAAVRAAWLDHGAHQVRLVLTGQGPRVLGVDPGIGHPPVPELVQELTGVDLAEAAIHLATGGTALAAAA
jgi:hypothetical protein